MTPLFSFWFGPLTWIERACIASILAQGHPLTIYTYDATEVSDLDPRVTIADARNALPLNAEISRQMAVRPALAANLIRYKLLEMRRGLWVDLDVLLLAPILSADYVMGYAERERKGSTTPY